MLKDYQKQILSLLEQLELEVSNIYKLFAEKFPARKELWSHLSDEEIKHAAYINRLSALAQEGNINFDEKMTKTFTVKSVLDDLREKYRKTENNQYSIINALSFSLSLERSVIEHKFYEYFNSNDPDITTMINTIKAETLSHEAQVKQALEEEKKNS
ncbi:MAG: hypothetical protein QMD11_12450 [Smithella sp.]|nr:hypothetical protein [Smithella sp.]